MTDTRNSTQRNHLRPPTPKRRTPTPEAKVTAEIKRYLAKIGAHVLRTGAGMAEIDGRKISIGQVGCSDLTCCIAGVFCAIEIKAGKNKPSEAQQKYLARVAAAGGIACVVWGAADVRAALVARFGEMTVKGWERR